MLKLGADDGAKTDTAGPMDTAGTSASSPRKCAVSSWRKARHQQGVDEPVPSCDVYN